MALEGLAYPLPEDHGFLSSARGTETPEQLWGGLASEL